jgi:addiction module HigA family antidote
VKINLPLKNDPAQHPGALLWSEWLDPLNVTVSGAARALGVTRKTLSMLLNGRQGISPEMSIRLGRALNVPEDAWLRKQREWDLNRVDRRRIKVKRLVPDTIALDVD